MNILEMCDSSAASVPVEATAEQAIRAMLDGHVGAVAIVDQEQRVAGIFSERDVLRRLSLSEHDPRKISVREVMTTPVEMATRATSASEALAALITRDARTDHPVLSMPLPESVTPERLAGAVSALLRAFGTAEAAAGGGALK